MFVDCAEADPSNGCFKRPKFFETGTYIQTPIFSLVFVFVLIPKFFSKEFWYVFRWIESDFLVNIKKSFFIV